MEPRVPVRVGWATRFSTCLAAGLACVVLLTLLGHKPLTNWDEGIYAEVSREMPVAGWLVPHWNGQVWLEKPPLMLWVTAVFFKVFGVTEFWARAGSALSGVAMVGLLHGWLQRRRGPWTAWLCTGILLSTFGFLHVCRVGEMDVLLSLGCCVALCGLTAARERKPSGWYLFWGGFAVAAMTKGGASIVLPITALVLVVLDRWGKRHFNKEFWWGLLLFLVLVLPWHLLMLRRYPRQFVGEYFSYHLLARATQPLEGHVTHGWFYLWVMLVSAMPWVLLYPMAHYAAFRQKELRAWAVFVLVELGFFSVVQTRLPHYIAPAYPAMALLMAVLIADRVRRFVSAGVPPMTWAKWAAAILAVSTTSIALTSGARGRLHRARAANGQALAGDKESVLLLRDFFQTPRAVREPVLLWRQDNTSSIATAVFYAKHPVQPVQRNPPDAVLVRDKYIADPVSLDQAVQTGAYLLLLEKPLLAEIPPGFSYRELSRGTTMDLGWVERR